MNIYTLTLNPAYDVHAQTEQFLPQHENFAQIRSREAGGKGVNISRALKNAGIEHTAVVVIGNENQREFQDALHSCGLKCLYFERPGRVRENLTVHNRDGQETRISFSGFRGDDRLLEEINEKLHVQEDTVVTFTGRVPEGIRKGAVMDFLLGLKKKGARLVLDSKSLSLTDVYALQPWLIKPNQEEISEYFACQVRSLEEAGKKAQEFLSKGIENVMISLGAQGALLATDVESVVALPPAITPVSTIGAGDSSIAGFLAAASAGCPAEDCLRHAVAFGTAACLTEGTQPPELAVIQKLLTEIQTERL